MSYRALLLLNKQKAPAPSKLTERALFIWGGWVALPITCSPTAGLVAKYRQRTPPGATTICLSLAHGLLNGWSTLPITCSPTAGLVAKYRQRTPPGVTTICLSLAHGLLNGWSTLPITCSSTAGLVTKSGHRTPRTALTCALSLAHDLPMVGPHSFIKRASASSLGRSPALRWLNQGQPGRFGFRYQFVAGS